MTDDRRQSDASRALSRDLREISRPPIEVPPSIDQAVRVAIRSHFGRMERNDRIRRFVSWVGAAAALIGLTLILSLPGQPGPPASSKIVASQRDLDGNGRVDMLDAFTLARWVEDGRSLDGGLDFNRDGQINRLDVDDIAWRAVAIAGGAS